MIKSIERLNARNVATTKTAGRHHDGGGLYLQVSKSGARSWLFRYQIRKEPRQMGLGPYPAISLAEARAARLECQKLLANDIDPIEQRRTQRAAKAPQQPDKPTFRECAESCVSDKRAEWRNEKHAKQWTSTLETYVHPHFGDVPVDQISTDHVLTALRPIWAAIPETARRVRSRIETVLNYAAVRGLRSGPNPAAGRGHLYEVLAKRRQVQQVKHRAALPYAEIPDFMRQLQRRGCPTALALEFLILTAARTEEVLGSRWQEIDFERRVWTIPAERMKASREHEVPLSGRAIAILETARRWSGGSEWVFPAQRGSGHLSNMSMLKLRDRLGRQDITVHGFRSTFRDWAAESGGYDRTVVEFSLAHSLPDRVEAAYLRTRMLPARRRLLDDWAAFCAGPREAGLKLVA